MPKKRKKSTIRPAHSRRERENFDWRWLIVPAIFVAMLVVGIFINRFFDGETVEKIASNITIDDGDEKINWGRYATREIALSSGPVKITKPGTYHLTGDLMDGGVELDIVNTEVKLILDNVTIVNPYGPAIYCGEGEDVVIELIGENYLEDTAVYMDTYPDTVNGTIYINADLTFTGDGSLTVVGRKADGIVGKDDLKFVSGAFIVRAVDDGIRGTDSLYIKDGDFRVTAKYDALKSTDLESHRKGFVLVEGGTFELTAGGKGIEATNVALVRGGNFMISSFEGIEARVIAIDGGDINITTTDDGLNAKNDNNEKCLILLDGGEVYINAAGDGIDANGRVTISGGSLIIDGPTNDKNGALDSDAGITMKGGEIIALGMMARAEAPLAKTSKVPTIVMSFAVAKSQGTTLEIRDETGNIIISHTSAKRFTHAVVSSDKLARGGSYEIYIDGKLYQIFTITDTITEFNY